MADGLTREDIILQNLGDDRSESGNVEEDERDRALGEEDYGQRGHEGSSEPGENDNQGVGEEVEKEEVKDAQQEHGADGEAAEKSAETSVEEVTPEDNGDAAANDEEPVEMAKGVDLRDKKETTTGVRKVLKSGIFGGKLPGESAIFIRRSYLWPLYSRCSQAYTASQGSCRSRFLCPTLPSFSCSR